MDLYCNSGGLDFFEQSNTFLREIQHSQSFIAMMCGCIATLYLLLICSLLSTGLFSFEVGTAVFTGKRANEIQSHRPIFPNNRGIYHEISLFC